MVVTQIIVLIEDGQNQQYIHVMPQTFRRAVQGY